MQAKLEYQANHDDLTGLLNRHCFTTLLKEEIRRAQRYQTPVSLIMYNIDHFKNVNDSHGH